eukprot:186479_1
MLATHWQCYGCRMSNTYNRHTCQACFRPRPKVMKSLSYKKQKQSTLINGCIKTWCAAFNSDIISIILLFYNDITEWVITPTDLENLFNNKTLSGPIIMINNLEFDEQLSFSSTNPNQVLFTITLKPSSHIKSVQLTYYLGCYETSTVYKRYTNTGDYNTLNLSSDEQLLSGCCFALSKDDLYKKLTLLSHIVILSCNNNIYRSILINQPNKNIKYVWYISEFLLSKFMTCKNGESVWCDDNFGIDDNFCVWCAPNGMKPKDKGKFLCYIGLLALPFNIKELFVNYTFEIKSQHNSLDCNGVNSFEYYMKYSSNGYLNSSQPYLKWNTNTISLKSLENLKTIIVIITVNIIEKA